MKLMVNHQTHYHYTQAARNSVQSIKMIPQSSRHQLVESWHISVPGQYTSKLDAFNNLWITATHRHDYHYLTIMAQGWEDLQPSWEILKAQSDLNQFYAFIYKLENQFEAFA